MPQGIDQAHAHPRQLPIYAYLCWQADSESTLLTTPTARKIQVSFECPGSSNDTIAAMRKDPAKTRIAW